MPDPEAQRSDEAEARDPRLDEPIPIWPNLKWALIILGTTIGIWWIAGPIVRWLGIDELVP